MTLVALMTSMVALSIDAMLPALAEIGADLGVGSVNDIVSIAELVDRLAADYQAARES